MLVVFWQSQLETHQEMRIPERDMKYIVLSVCLYTLISPIRHEMDHTEIN